MGKMKKFFDEYEEYRVYQEVFSEDDNSDTEELCVQQVQSVEKKARKLLSAKELERNGKIVRIIFITLGVVFSVATLWNNIGWLFFLPAFASWPGIIVSVVVLVLIAKNINYHRKERKKDKNK